MSEYDDIDALTGGKAIDPMNQGMPAFQVKSYERIKPAKEQKFQGGNSASKISADPQNETVELIISALNDNKLSLIHI